MRILFSAQNFLNEVGGAEISAQTLLRRLAARHEIHVISRGERGSYEWEGIHVHEIRCPDNILYINLRWGAHLDSLGIKPDLVITQVNAAAPTALWCKTKGIPCIFYVRSFEHFCLDVFKHGDAFKCDHRCWRCEGLKGALLYPAYRQIYGLNKQALRTADLVIAQSLFMRDVVEHYTGRVCDVVPNAMDLEGCHTDKRGDAILFVTPIIWKGVELVSQLVRRCRNRRFVLVGRIEKGYEWLAKEENVEYMGFVSDMREAYGKAKVLVVPSDMAESSARVIPEAMINGIPCIVSDVGGAAEMGGDAAIKLNNRDVDGWSVAIERLYEDMAFYDERSKACSEQVKGYTLDGSLNALKELVEERIKLTL